MEEWEGTLGAISLRFPECRRIVIDKNLEHISRLSILLFFPSHLNCERTIIFVQLMDDNFVDSVLAKNLLTAKVTFLLKFFNNIMSCDIL